MPAIQFGFCVPIFAAPGAGLFRTPGYASLNTATTINMARLAEDLGYDSLWVADHLMLGRDDAILEGWTTLAALAGATSRIKLGMIHYANLFRHPALTAKMVATLDQISGGRLIHFFDAGHQRREHTAYGLPWSESADERVERMVEALQLTLALWQADQPLTFSGKYYQVENAICQPGPLQQPHPPIWLGELHPEVLRACARYAQGWNSVPMAPADMRARLDTLAAACTEAGRSFAELEKSMEVQVLVAPNHATLREQVRAIIALDPAGQPPVELQAFLDGVTDTLPGVPGRTWISGTPDQAANQLQEYIDLGITHFMLWFADAPQSDGLRLFAQEVAPRFREQVI